jgi:hypothetical protein
VAVEGAMGQSDVFGGRREDQRVFAHHLPTSQGCEADAAGLACAGVAMTSAFHHVGQRHAAALGDRTAHADRGAGRRVHLLSMVHFHDLGVVGIGRQRGTHALR